MYKALEDIGGYKKGDIVPDEKGIVWAKMYDVSPVEKVEDNKQKKVEPVEQPKKAKETKGDSTGSPMLDDYLARKGAVVIKAIKEDDLDKETLAKLLKLEKSDKDRFHVKKVIEAEMEG